MRLSSGLYEQVISLALAEGLSKIRSQVNYHIVTEDLDGDTSHPVLAQYIYEVMNQGLRYLRERYGEEEGLAKQVHACNELIQMMASMTNQTDLLEWRIGPDNQRLLAILEQRNTRLALQRGNGVEVLRPETPLSVSTLFTGSSQEPSMASELKKEILTADRLDMLVSFIKWSGLRLIMDELKEFTQTRQLRIITTSYMGATDLKAILELAKLPNTEIRISYDTRTTRLHAKSYMFYRETGFSTVYIGSSNLSSAAIGGGLEWNVKVTEKDMPHIVRNVAATFETYWNDEDFIPFALVDAPKLNQALKIERQSSDGDEQYAFRIEPYPFQKEILDKLDAERRLHGRYRNLVVAATGTGKTVVSAFDYRRYCRQNQGRPARLLFVAHRREILHQSLKCFRAILRDSNFGELFYGDRQPERFDHLFISIQTFNSQAFHEATSPDFYDFIIVDEFHHAAAASYQQLLSYYRPRVLLGLTATPERMDGADIVSTYFDGIMAAEIRLPEAINRQLLVPFQYFGVTDDVDLSTIKFERGKYDLVQLENVYTGNDARTDMIIRALRRYITDIDTVVGLGFCVGVGHAQYMASRFCAKGIPSIALHGGSNATEREFAQRRLVNGEIRFIFTVDLYNEGVDIPEVNTILFLRPTESFTVFLQQLGRGLRHSEGKDVLTVLDFIGQAHVQYSFEPKFRAMLSHSRRSIQKEIEDGFPSLPRGSYIQLEKVARDVVLNNIRNTIINKRNIIRRIASQAWDGSEPLTLREFLRCNDNVSPSQLYKFGTFADLSVQAGVSDPYDSPDEDIMQKAMLRLSRVNSRRWINFVIDLLRDGLPAQLTDDDTRMLGMLHYTVWQKLPSALGMSGYRDGLERIRSNTVLCAEMIELLSWCYEQISFVDQPIQLGFPCPLDLHCSYSRDQILAGVGHWTSEKRPEMREGVLYVPHNGVDLLLITLNKSDKHFSPTTMYEDYAINDTLFHWQSQSTTSSESSTGQRYINHRHSGSQVLLFVRDFKQVDSQAQPYTYLGKANYVSHTGSRPMSIVWKLEEPMPATMVSKAVQAGVV